MIAFLTTFFGHLPFQADLAWAIAVMKLMTARVPSTARVMRTLKMTSCHSKVVQLLSKWCLSRTMDQMREAVPRTMRTAFQAIPSMAAAHECAEMYFDEGLLTIHTTNGNQRGKKIEAMCIAVASFFSVFVGSSKFA